MIVACKIPNGILLHDGTTILGPAKVDPRLNPSLPKLIPNNTLVYGYALTHNVDADAWAEWLKANIKSDMVVRRLIFADADIGVVRNMAYVNRSTSSGMQQSVRT